jgi:UDP-3-O-[3-hydroxymyristoyl] glucosamine N-acyltransferase
MPSEISDSAAIGSAGTLGEFCVIEADVQIGDGCEIGHHVIIREGTIIGDNVRIDDHTTVGKQPMKAANSAVTGSDRQPPAQIGDGCLIGAQTVIYAGCQIDNNVLVADQASIREEVTVGAQTIVGRGVAIENRCSIGARCKLETNAYIAAHSNVGDDAFIAPGVLTSNDNYIGRTEERFEHYGGVTVEQGGRIGVGAVILPNKKIEADAVVAAGAVLTHDAEEAMILTGVPARPHRPVPEEQLLENQSI